MGHKIQNFWPTGLPQESFFEEEGECLNYLSVPGSIIYVKPQIYNHRFKKQLYISSGAKGKQGLGVKALEELEIRMPLTGWWKLKVGLIAVFSSMQWHSKNSIRRGQLISKLLVFFWSFFSSKLKFLPNCVDVVAWILRIYNQRSI